MDENQTPGGAGPALAAHSKDGSVPGPTRASGATGDNGDRAGVADTVSRLSGQAREAAGRASSSISGAAGSARQTISDQGGQAVDQVSTFVRDQPLAALAITGMIGLALGVMLARH
jgi:ElaB/YqjD/DUF883 family membrane-anchored ribosome-binding protein